MENVAIIIFVIIIFVIILAALGMFSSSSPPPSNVKRNTIRPPKPSQSDGLDALFTVLAVGVTGYVAYKFIKAVTEELNTMQINVNGEYQTIAKASKNNSFVEELVKEFVQKKAGNSSASSNPHEAAEDIAKMLRDALKTRMKQQNL